MERHHVAGDLREYFAVNQDIHGFILTCSRNRALKATHDSVLARVKRARFFALSSRARWDQSVEEHRAVMHALRARDAAAAGKLLAAHVQRTGHVVNDILHADRSSGPWSISPAGRSSQTSVVAGLR
jgi:DNA-binding GntR family transcriptional regulator